MFELKLTTGKVVRWPGKDGIDASYRYVDCHRDAAVVAWRYADQHITVLGRRGVIDESGRGKRTDR